MSHSCRALLCDSPHYDNDGHPDGCLCETCHPEHLWAEWGFYPYHCEGCLQQLLVWLQENVDEPMCACGSFRIYVRDYVAGIYECCWDCYRANDDEMKSLKEAL